MGKENGVVWYAQRHDVGYYLPKTNSELNVEGPDVTAARSMLREILTLQIAAISTNWIFSGMHFQGATFEGEVLNGDLVLDSAGFIKQVNVSNSKGKWLQANYSDWYQTVLGYYPRIIEFVDYSSPKDQQGRIAKAWHLDEVTNLLPPRGDISVFNPAYHVVLSKVGRIEWENGIAYSLHKTNRLEILKPPKNFAFTGSKTMLVLIFVICTTAGWILLLVKRRIKPFGSGSQKN